jgi:hypothetical protein
VSSTGPHSAGGFGQLTSLLVTQLNILLSTLKESNFDTQADKIRSIVDDNGMEVFTTLFRRLLQSNASTIFPGSARPPTTTDAAGQYRLLADEIAKVSRDPLQAEKIAQSLDTNESELFRDFDLSTFIDHFRLNPIAKVALVLPIRAVSKPDLRSKGMNSILVKVDVRQLTCDYASGRHPHQQLAAFSTRPLFPSSTEHGSSRRRFTTRTCNVSRTTDPRASTKLG